MKFPTKNPMQSAIKRMQTNNSKNKNSAESSDSDSTTKTAQRGRGEDSDSTSSSDDEDSGILLSYICRNDVVLVEARASGCAEYSELVTQISVGLRKMKATPGWEFFRLPILSRKGSSVNKNLKGAKFHIQDHNPKDEGGVCIWSIGCVYDTDIVPKQHLFDQTAPPSIQSFVEHVERESKSFREDDDVWKYGGPWACQHQFAPKLWDIMGDLSWYDRKFEREQHIDKLKDIMLTNINTILEQEEKIENVLDKANQLEEQAMIFKKNCKRVNKALKRKYYMKKAVYGAAGATAITAVVGVPCLLLL